MRYLIAYPLKTNSFFFVYIKKLSSMLLQMDFKRVVPEGVAVVACCYRKRALVFGVVFIIAFNPRPYLQASRARPHPPTWVD